MIDNVSGWGKPGTPLLPGPLRSAWADETMPAWICKELRVPLDSTFAVLDSSIWQRATCVSDRVLVVLSNLLRARISEVASLPLVFAAQIDAISLVEAPFSVRSHNALHRAGLIGRARDVAQMSLGDLLRIPALGTRSVLDVACVMEALMNARAAVFQQLGLFSAKCASTEWTEQLEQIAAKPWAAFISEKDARFVGMFPNDGEGTVLERIERVLAEPDSISSIVRGPELASIFESLECALEHLEKLSLDEALTELLVASGRKRRNQIEALSARFGWAGESPKTLEGAAKPLGITRERVRQIEDRFLKGMPDDLYLPQLDLAIDMLERSAPITIPAADKLLVTTGICKGRFSSESVILTAAMLRRETNLRIEHVKKKGRLIVGSHSSVRGVAFIARKLAGMAGVASVYQVSSSQERTTATVDDARRILKGLSNVEFLSEDWFWVIDIPVRRNRLSNIAKKILSVASPQSVQSIREGLRRAFTYRSKSNVRYETLVTPPSDVLAAFFKHSPEFKVQGETVSPVQRLDYLNELGDVDRTLVQVLRSTTTGVLDRRGVVEACVARGLNESSVSIFLTYSPIVEHVGIDIWKLRGVQVDPAAVEALREANASEPLEKRVLNFGWRPDGKLWIASKLPYSLASFVLGVPGSTKRYLANSKFTAVDKVSGASCGQVSIGDSGTSFGYSTFFRVSGAEPSDVMLAEFDIAARQVELSLTDDIVLDTDELG